MTENNAIIVLIGLMGVGKSRVGRELAKLMGLPFFDSDREIEKAACFSISEIFERFGETDFRRREREVMKILLNGKASVLASGGGAFIQDDIRTLIKQRAISIWLQADINVLVQRIARSSHRPLLRSANPAERLQELMEDRYPVYGEADIIVATDRQTPHDIAEHIKTEVGHRAGKK